MLVEDARRYDSDSLGSSAVWGTWESFGVREMTIIGGAKAVEYEARRN